MVNSRWRCPGYALLLPMLVVAWLVPSSNGGEPILLIWSSSGGGWRSMMSNVGWANSFKQAGLFGSIGEPTPSTPFRSISTNSGGSWFSLQFFFSPFFYNRTLDSNITNLRSFVVDWMESYVSLQANLPPASKACGALGVVPGLGNPASLCDVVTYYQGNWANLIQDMLDMAAQSYGDIAHASSRVVNHSSRVSELASVDLYIQISLTPNAKSLAAHPWQQDSITYLGPKSSQDEVYAIALPVQYSIQGNRSFYKYAVDDADLPFNVYLGPAPDDFQFRDWKSFYLYPPLNGNLTTSCLPNRAGLLKDSQFKEPFGGIPSVAALAASSGAAGAVASGLIPSFLAQRLSIPKQGTKVGSDASALAQGKAIYKLRLTGDLSVCAQWPARCGQGDFRFIDGGFSDGPSLAMTIGQLQQSSAWNKNIKLKVIETNNNFFADSNAKFLSYFQTPFNSGISPGAFIWPPGIGPKDILQPNPMRSVQIFQDYLDDQAMLAAFEPIPGTNLTTAIYRNLTTTNNTAFGVIGGFTVDLLLLQINSNIPTLLLGADATQANVEPLANLSVTIAQSAILVDRIKAFVDG